MLAGKILALTTSIAAAIAIRKRLINHAPAQEHLFGTPVEDRLWDGCQPSPSRRVVNPSRRRSLICRVADPTSSTILDRAAGRRERDLERSVRVHGGGAGGDGMFCLTHLVGRGVGDEPAVGTAVSPGVPVGSAPPPNVTVTGAGVGYIPGQQPVCTAVARTSA